MASVDEEKNTARHSTTQHEELVKDEHLGHLVTHEDHETSKWQAIKQNPICFFWCLYAVWTILLVTFENQAAGNVLGIPRFRQDFGHLHEGDYVIPGNWQSAFSGAPLATNVVGCFASAAIADKIGRRFTIMIALVLSFVSITLEVVATTNAMFFGGKFLNGFAIGTFQTVSTAYLGEIVPTPLRGFMTCLNAMAYTLGPFTVALIVNSTGQMESRWAYRAVFVSQYGFAAVAAAGSIWMPESPWWLVSKDRHDQAENSLQKLGHRNGEEHKRLANIRVTLQEIRRETEGVTYMECFRKSNLRRTIVSLSPITIQQLTGIVFAASYSTYYAQLAGYSVSMSFKLQITQQVLSITGNIMSWDLIDRVGRRPLTIYGLVGLTTILWVMGGLAVGGSPAMLRGTVAMILIYCWLYNVTIGATSWTVVTETATARLRPKTVAIGNVSNSLLSIIWQFTMPYMFNPDQANLGGKVGFIFGGLSFVCIGYLWWYMPETKGRTYEELDEMFMKKVPARKFGEYKTEVEAKGVQAQQNEAQS